MIHLYHVAKEYEPGRPVLSDVTFHVQKGEFVFLTGPSGAGKTTLLRLLFRQEVPTQGQILVNGRNVGVMPRAKIPHLRRQLGVVFQEFRLLPRRTVLDNVACALSVLGTPRSEQKRRAFAVLGRVGLHHRMHARPAQLSGGEQQRVAIARALINDPVLLLADEPTGNLDPGLALEILQLFREINSYGTTIVFATHDRNLIRVAQRRVLLLERGHVREGR